MDQRGITTDRKSGVLLNVSSLPGPFAVGVFGEEAKDFARRIREMGFSYWQILPLGPVDMGNSPYCSDSAFAGNELYIDPRGLEKMGLLTEDEVKEAEYGGSPYAADYAAAAAAKEIYLDKAFQRFLLLPENSDIFENFTSFREQNKWAQKYGEYRALKEANGGKSWDLWEILTPDPKLAQKTVFRQFLFDLQWREIKSYANGIGVKIIGDMPLYVAYDSCDVWAEPENFQLDPGTGKPTGVAGVPPDYFSEDGQLWRNPLYDWKALKKNGFDWWYRRVKTAMERYDVLRIDHFRGLASYWSVPYGEESAKAGHWEKGPGMDLFRAIAPAYEGGEIIAEDLGVFGEDVIRLLKSTGFAGMRVVQFGFDSSYNSTNLPHKYVENSIAYLGTHDNNTLFGWIYAATPEEREYVLKYCGFSGDWTQGGYGSRVCRAVIETVWKSQAKLTMIQLQDLCGFGADTRMNVPGVAEGNWAFRAAKETLDRIDAGYYREINRIFSRD